MTILDTLASHSRARTLKNKLKYPEEEIKKEMGSPKKVAAELNEQMKEYAYRKSPWRFVFLAAAVLSGGWLVFYHVMQLLFTRIVDLSFTLLPSETASLGIIGGADGPTSIFITGPDWPQFAIGAAICAVVLVVGIVLLRKSKR